MNAPIKPIKPIKLSAAQIEQFRDRGFLILEKFLDPDRVSQIDERLDPLFQTRFETGIYPDEWHGRPGLSRPEATRQMVGMWRCDRTVASLSLSSEIARLNATLAGWSGGRLAMDSCWIKPPDAPEVLFHRSSTLVSCIAPSEIVTCWIALGDTTKDMGTLELIPGSHRWTGGDRFQFLHAPETDYRQPVWDLGIASPESLAEILAIELPAGGCVFLHGDLWRGSGRNRSNQTRRSIAISTLPADAQFRSGTGTGYIFSRYRRLDSCELDESFFPILWTEDGYRSPFATAYCADLLNPDEP